MIASISYHTQLYVLFLSICIMNSFSYYGIRYHLRHRHTEIKRHDDIDYFFKKFKHSYCNNIFVLDAQGPWRKDEIPSGYEQVESLAATSLNEALQIESFDNVSESDTMYIALAVDVLTPGLNPKLEQKAPFQWEFLFRLVTRLLPILNDNFAYSVLMFPSAGDAAGFEKYCRRIQYKLADNIICIGLSSDFSFPTQQSSNDNNIESIKGSVMFINCKNNVGDPVIDVIQRVLMMNHRLTGIFLNCDLSDKVTPSIQSRKLKDSFRATIKQAFYFRNIVTVSRPSLVPTEMGTLLFRPSRGWEVFVTNQDDVYGPGSLNRFMSLAVYQRNENDCNANNPPLSSLVGRFPTQPTRDDIESVLNRVNYRSTDKIINNDPLGDLLLQSMDRNVAIKLLTVLIDGRQITNNLLDRIPEAVKVLVEESSFIATHSDSETSESLTMLGINEYETMSLIPYDQTFNKSQTSKPLTFVTVAEIKEESGIYKCITYSNLFKEIWSIPNDVYHSDSTYNYKRSKVLGVLTISDTNGAISWNKNESSMIDFQIVFKSDNILLLKSTNRLSEFTILKSLN